MSNFALNGLETYEMSLVWISIFETMKSTQIILATKFYDDLGALLKNVNF